MAWHCYKVILRLRTPLHIGWSKIGNVQRTRPYITGRVLWGALTMRMTRDRAHQQRSVASAQAYRDVGEQVHQQLAYSYFYPATESNRSYQIAWPWEHPAHFRYRFLSSYGSTALSYPQQSAATGMLHEVEFLAPHTIDTGEPVYVIGYIFVADSCTLPWQAALQRLQVGGERGYGWGDLALIDCQPVDGDNRLFEEIRFNGKNERPILQIEAGKSLLAHTCANGTVAEGEIEPLVGREWHHHPGQQVKHSGVCFVPGSKLEQNSAATRYFTIERLGVWK
ncbi:hypothetical protein [Candidatus Viridilinea mediisalina]|uniref:CRISPR-associated protein n=1 Tax=Candidatus Viridilinea mediisalina TaxID=2024553 RepID=A0A2A6RGA8_9CHLR|nr:hypothetical protein [Candidatus Viridilinea mediisalina]PDW02164.1 hypothetical protein CJ255_15410 [Candidatus Viridilinea mediisalina]